MTWLRAIVAVSAPALAVAAAVAAGDPRARVLHVDLDDEAITAVTAEHLVSVIRRAEDEDAACVVVELDTPGGLVDATRVAVKGILRADVPVAVFVPPGGRAASAGLFVTLAAHVAAMAPGSNIGAAHPVQIGGLPIAPPEPEQPGDGEPAGDRSLGDVLEKAVQDTTAWARSLAQARGRNAEWAALAVTESRSASAQEALELGVVDLVAEDVEDLLLRIDGRSVTLAGGRSVTLRTAGAPLERVEMWWGQRLLAAISHPNVAFLLLVFGFYGILFELYSPGWGVAGTLGVIALVLSFFALSVLPVNYVGLTLVALALGMFVAEAFVTSYGLLTLGGAVCLVVGGVMLVDSPEGFLRISTGVVVPVAAATALVAFFLVGAIVKAHRRKAETGAEGLVGAQCLSEAAFEREDGRYLGTVRTHGEFWKAASPEPVAAGQTVEVLGREGFTLLVGRPSRSPTSPPAPRARPEAVAEESTR